MANAPIFAGTFAARALSEGQSATQGLRAFREAGGGIRTQRWYQLFGQAEFALGERSSEVGRPLNRRPERSSLPAIATRDKTGIQQRVRVFGFAKDGAWDSRLVTVRSPNGVSRANAIRHAMTTVSTTTGTSGGLNPVTGVHIEAFQEVPGETGSNRDDSGRYLPGGGSES